MKVKFLISFDIDGTLGKHTSKINDINNKHGIMDYSHIIKIPNYTYGDFIFYKGIVDMLKTMNRLVIENKGDIFITTAGLGSVRNETIINYINKLLNRVDNPIYLYDITYQTFHNDRIQNSINALNPDAWDNWFKLILTNHEISSLNIVRSDVEFSHFYYRDHQYIIDKHPERFNNLSLSNILHLDDMPYSVKTLNKDGTEVKVIIINQDHPNKIEECVKVLEEVKAFINEKK